MTITDEKIKKLCGLINGKLIIPEGHTNKKCVVDETKPYTGKEEVRPYIFHKINNIIEAKRNINRFNETLQISN